MRELVEYAAARALEAGLAALPGPAARRAGETLGRLARRPLGLRRRVVERHLARAFPARSAAWVERTARACFRHFGREVAALARAGRTRPADLAGAAAGTERTAAVLGAAVEDGPGALLVTGHLGNWELAGGVLSGLGFPVSAVVKRQGNARVHRRLGRLRRRLGVEPVPMSAAGRRVPEALGQGRVVALVADQDAGRRGLFVPFLGRPASTFRGPARLALRHEVPLVFGALVREGGRYSTLTRRVWPPGAGAREGAPPGGPGGRPGTGEAAAPGAGGASRPGATGSAGGPAGERALTAAWVGELERAVRSRPEQYFWFHRRWKTRPEPDREPS